MSNFPNTQDWPDLGSRAAEQQRRLLIREIERLDDEEESLRRYEKNHYLDGVSRRRLLNRADAADFKGREARQRLDLLSGADGLAVAYCRVDGCEAGLSKASNFKWSGHCQQHFEERAGIAEIVPMPKPSVPPISFGSTYGI